MTARTVFLKTHLYLGLTGALFLFVLALTGSIMAFEGDIEHWVNPSLWYVKTGPRILSEDELIRIVERQFAPARVVAVQLFRQPDLAQVIYTSDRAAVHVNPYDGSILRRTTGASSLQRTLGYIHQLHLRLVPDPRSYPAAAKVGAQIVEAAGVILCLLVPTGLVIWWRAKRASIKWSGSWFRICFDAHNVTGVWASLFLFCAAATGVLIGSESILYWLTRSAGPTRPPQVRSADAAPGTAAIGVDRAVEIARAAIPVATVAGIQLPANPKAAYMVLLRVPEDTSEAVHSFVFVDQFSGAVLHVHNFLTDSQGYRAVRFNRSIHTGDVLGTVGHVIVSLSSLLLAVMVVTGLVIWWKKLAV